MADTVVTFPTKVLASGNFDVQFTIYNNNHVLVPEADVDVGNWAPTPLYGSLDEGAIANDSDYVYSDNYGNAPVSDTMIVRLTANGLIPFNKMTVHYRVKKTELYTSTIDVVAYLMQGSTQLASDIHNNISTSYNDFSFQVATNLITDPYDLRFKLVATKSSGTSANAILSNVYCDFQQTTTDPFELRIEEMDKLKYELREDDYVFFPSYQKVKIFAVNSLAWFEELLNSNTEVRLHFSDETYYFGDIDRKTLLWDHKANTVSFNITDNAQILKQIKLKNLEGAPTDPLGYGAGSKNLKDMILEILHLVSPGFSIDFGHDWKFRESSANPTPEYDFDEVKIFPGATLFGADALSKHGGSNMADILKIICRDFGCYCGLTDKYSAHVKKYWGLSVTPISISESVVLEKVISIVTVEKTYTEILGPTAEGYIYYPSTPPLTVADEDIFRLVMLFDQSDSWYDRPHTGAGSVSAIWNPTMTDALTQTSDPSIDSGAWDDNVHILAKYWYIFWSKPRRRYELTLKGIDFYMHEFYSYGGYNRLRPVLIEKDFEKNETRIELFETGVD